MTWPSILLLACFGATPIYDPEPEQPWNRVHQLFYTHEFSNGVVYAHETAFEPPFYTWARFYNDDAFHAHAVSVLDAFFQQSEEEVERQAPLRRALLWRDLWPVFDAQTFEWPQASPLAVGRQKTLRERVAGAMRRLVLTRKEVDSLPDNYRRTCEQKRYPAAFDPAAPERPFLPPDLLDADGSWVPFARNRKSFGAQAHVQSTKLRTIFVPLIRISANRQETLDFLTRYTKTGGVLLPSGTMMALVRQTVVAGPTGELLATPLTESVQLVVVERPQAHRNKFVWDRRALLDGQPGLRAVEKDEIADAWGFETTPLYAHKLKKDTDGELLVSGREARTAKQGMPVLGTCVVCHGSAPGAPFGNSGANDRAEPFPFDEQVWLILSQKEKTNTWKAYRELFD